MVVKDDTPASRFSGSLRECISALHTRSDPHYPVACTPAQQSHLTAYPPPSLTSHSLPSTRRYYSACASVRDMCRTVRLTGSEKPSARGFPAGFSSCDICSSAATQQPATSRRRPAGSFLSVTRRARMTRPPATETLAPRRRRRLPVASSGLKVAGWPADPSGQLRLSKQNRPG